MKPCNVCNVVKADEDFAQSKDKPDGLANFCRDCGKERAKRWYRENRARKIAHSQAYKEEHGTVPVAESPRRQRLQREKARVQEEAQSELQLIRFTEAEWLFCLVEGDRLGLKPADFVRYLVKDAKLKQEKPTE